MKTTVLTTSEFIDKVYDYNSNPGVWNFKGEKPALIDFFASWCGPCKMMSPVLDEMSELYSAKIDVYKVNVDEEPELSEIFGIRSIPSLLFVPKGNEPSMVQGAMPKNELKKLIDDLLLG